MLTASIRGEVAMQELIESVDRECAVLTQSGTASVSTLNTGFAHATRREPLAGSAATARPPTDVLLFERSLPPDASSSTGATDDLDS